MELLTMIKNYLRLTEDDDIFNEQIKNMIGSTKELLINAGVPARVVNSDKVDQVIHFIGCDVRHKFNSANDVGAREHFAGFDFHLNQLAMKDWSKWLDENV